MGFTENLDLQGEVTATHVRSAELKAGGRHLASMIDEILSFAKLGENRLRLRAKTDRVTFEIRNTGIGIATKHHERVFERSWQVGSGSTRAVDGMVIELAAAREYARLLRGDNEPRERARPRHLLPALAPGGA